MVALLVFAAGLATLLLAIPGLMVLTGLLALGFLYCQARILLQSKGVPLWREPRIVPLILATGLTEGCGLLLIASTVLPAPTTPIAAVLLLLAAYRAVAWRRYRGALTASGAPARALDALDRIQPWMIGLGAIAPAALAVAGILLPQIAAGLYGLAGLGALAAGWLFKFTLVTTAAYNQGFALERTPSRGAGGTGAGIKPGWR